jgi:hypothetical protein
MKTALDKLSKPQRRALIDLCSYGVIYRDEMGWRVGRVLHRHVTLKSLRSRRLCDITPIGRFGTAYPTTDAMNMVRAERDAINEAIRVSESRSY